MTKLINAYKTFPQDIADDVKAIAQDACAALAILGFVAALTLHLPAIEALVN